MVFLTRRALWIALAVVAFGLAWVYLLDDRHGSLILEQWL